MDDEDFETSLYPGEVYTTSSGRYLGPRQWVKQPFHDTLGAFFMAHPPIHTFPVKVADAGHTLTQNIPEEFSVADELYLVELQGDLRDYKILLTTEYDILGVDMERSNYAYTKDYDWDPTRRIDELHALFENEAAPRQSEMLVDRDPGERNQAHPALGHRNTRPVAYEREVGRGAVCYLGLGHNQVRLPAGQGNNTGGPPGYKGPWDNPVFTKLVKNAIAWACEQ